MRVLLAELAPSLHAPEENLSRLEAAIAASPSDLAIFPELYLSGYRVGDRVHHAAFGPGHLLVERLGEIARTHRQAIVVGAPWRSPERPGEVWNAALLAQPDGTILVQAKRYLPTFGPFEEGVQFTPVDRSRPIRALGTLLGVEICYDAFFPEVSRELALGGAELLAVISAAPVTSRRLFDRILPARAIENAVPLVYVNRVGAEEGIVFGGGSVALDARGEELPLEPVSAATPREGGRIVRADIDLATAARWRRARPVLRDVASRAPRGPPTDPAALGSLAPR